MTISANFPNVQPSLLLDFANAKQLPPQVTFTRATTATYYDGSTTSLAEQNLFIYSQQFDVWPIARATVTANTTVAPDGTTTADTITQTSTGLYGTPYRLLTTNAAIYTQSVYAKAGTASWLFLGDENSGKRAYFNISAGTIGSVASGATATITSVGSGWYRCSVTFTLAAVQGTFINAIVDGDGSTSAVGGTTIILWGAQLEQRSAASAYTATTAQAITNYNPALLTAGGGQPRFDHNPTTSESLGLLIEEQRTNIQPYSEAFGSWTIQPGGCSVQSNVTIAPDGTLTVDKLTSAPASAGAQSTRIYYSNNVTSGQAYTFSVYAKAGGYTKFSLVGSSSGWVGKAFEIKYDLSTGTITSQSLTDAASITAVGNGWYRCTVTATPVATNSGTIPIDVLDSGGNASFVGNGFSGIFLWGAQFEAGAFPTSYIPTATAAATRAADVASMTGANFSSWYNAGEGSFYSSVLARGYVLNQMLFSATDGTLTNPVQTYFDSASQIQANVWGNGTVLRAATIGTQVEYALGMAVNNVSATIGGGNVTTDTSAGPAYPYTQLNIGNRNGTLVFNGTIRKIAYYPIRVTDAQLQALTS